MSISAPTAARRISRIFGLSLSAALIAFTFGCGEDSVMGDDEKYMTNRDTNGTGNEPRYPNDCDMSGIWVAQLFAVSEAMGTLKAESHNWFYFELDDQGDEVVIERSMDCGFVVCGKATQIQLTDEQTRGLALRNRQDGILNTNPDDFSQAVTPDEHVAPRKITYKKLDDGTCEFSMERWWSIRSAPSEYLPDREAYGTTSIGDMQTQKPLPPKASPPAVTPGDDWDLDGDGKIGLNLQLDKPIAGWRDAIQRDWNEVPTTRIADGMLNFTVPANFDNEETVYGAEPSLLDQTSNALANGNNLRFVKVDDAAPDNMEGFIAYCEQKIEEHFREDDSTGYCDLKRQRLNVGPIDGEDE